MLKGVWSNIAATDLFFNILIIGTYKEYLFEKYFHETSAPLTVKTFDFQMKD